VGSLLKRQCGVANWAAESLERNTIRMLAILGKRLLSLAVLSPFLGNPLTSSSLLSLKLVCGTCGTFGSRVVGSLIETVD
jgi:hypothetical protein